MFSFFIVYFSDSIAGENCLVFDRGLRYICGCEQAYVVGYNFLFSTRSQKMTMKICGQSLHESSSSCSYKSLTYWFLQNPEERKNIKKQSGKSQGETLT